MDSESFMASQTTPDFPEDDDFVLISEDHESLPQFQSWVVNPGYHMTSSSNHDQMKSFDHDKLTSSSNHGRMTSVSKSKQTTSFFNTSEITSSCKRDSSLNTCLEDVKGRAKKTHQLAYEQNLLLNNISAVNDQLSASQNDTATEEAKKLLQKLGALQKEKDEILIEASALRHKVEYLEKENEKLRSSGQYPGLYSFRRDVREHFSQLSDDIKRLTEENKELSRKLYASEFHRQKLNKDLSNNSELLAAQMKAVENMEQNQQMRNELEQLRKSNVDLKSKHEVYKFESENSKSALSPLHELIKNLQVKEELATKKASTLAENNEKMEKELKNLAKAAEDSKQREEKQIAELEDLKKELGKLEQKLTESHKEREKARKEVEKIASTNSSVTRKLKSLASKAQDLSAKNLLDDKNLQNSEQIQSDDDVIGHLEKLMSNFLEAYKLLEIHNQEFFGGKLMEDQEFPAHKDDNPMKVLIQEFVQEIEKRQQTTVKENQEKFHSLQEKIRRLEAEKNELILKLEENEGAYVKKLELLETEKNEIYEQKETTRSNLEMTAKKLKEVNSEKQKISEKFKEDCQKMEAHNNQLLIDIQNLKVNRTQIESKWKTSDSKLAVATQELKELTADIRNLKKKKESADLECEKFTRQRKESEDEVKRLRQNEKDLKTKEENLKSVIQQLQKQLKILEDQNTEETKRLQNEVEVKEKENSELKVELKNLNDRDPTYEEIAQYAKVCHETLIQKERLLRETEENYEQLKLSSKDEVNKLRMEQSEIIQKEVELRKVMESNATELQTENRKLKLQLVKFTQVKLEEDERALGSLKLKQAGSFNFVGQTSQTSGCRGPSTNKDTIISDLEKKLKFANDEKELFKIQAEDFAKDFHDERERANNLRSKFEAEKDDLEFKNAQLEADLEDLQTANRKLKATISQLDSEKLEMRRDYFGGAVSQRTLIDQHRAFKSRPIGAQNDVNVLGTSRSQGPNIKVRTVRSPRRAEASPDGGTSSDGAEQPDSGNDHLHPTSENTSN